MNHDNDYNEIDGPTVLSAVRGRTRLVAAVLVVGAVLGMLAATLLTPGYVARADVYLSDPTSIDPAYPIRPVGGDFGRFVGGQAQVMRSLEVLTIAGESANASVEGLREATATRSGGGDEYIVLQVTSTSVARASELRTAILDAYGTYRSTLLNAQVQTLSPDEETINRLNVYADGVASTELTVDGGGSPMRLIQFGVLGGSVAVGMLLAALWILEIFRPSVRSAEDIELRERLPLLGTVRGGTDAVSGLETIALSLMHQVTAHGENPADNAVAVIPVDEASQDANFALALTVQAGQAGLAAFMIDSARHVYGDRQLPGSVISTTRRDGLLTIGTNSLLWPMDQARSAEFGARQREESIRAWFAQFGPSSNLRVVDSPSPSVDQTALRFAAIAPRAVLVVRAGTKLQVVTDLMETLRRVGIDPLGYVFQLDSIDTEALNQTLGSMLPAVTQLPRIPPAPAALVGGLQR